MSNSNKEVKYVLVTAQDFDPSKVIFTKAEFNEISKSTMAVPYYGSVNTQVQIQMPEITIYTYGMNSPGQYAPDKQSRLKIKLPFDPQNADMNALAKKFQQVDEQMEKKETVEKIFGKKKKVNYTGALHREANIKNLDDMEEILTKPSYFSAKIQRKSYDGDEYAVKTKVYTIKKVDGKKTVEEVQGNIDVDELREKYIPYKSTITPVMRLGKIWINSKNDYGISLFFDRVMVSERMSSKPIETGPAFFLDNETTFTSATSVDDHVKQDSKQDSKQNSKQDSKQDSNQDSNQDSKQVTVSASDSDSDSDSNSNSNSDSDSDEDSEEEAPPSKSKKTKGKSAKK
jgi:hypothetical protein